MANTEKRPVGRPVGSTKVRKQFGIIQLDKDAWQLCKDYCEEHGHKIGAFTAIAIRKYIAHLKK